jgi:hypothetical protein
MTLGPPWHDRAKDFIQLDQQKDAKILAGCVESDESKPPARA